jgi:hypothetical protein
MIIDNQKYKLTDNNFTPIECIKKQIIFGNTFNHNMKHVIGWEKRHNGKYNKTAAFTIDAAGLVYEHFNPSFHSNYFDSKTLNIKSIVILLENDGWLLKDEEKNQFITWIGDIYNKPNEVFEKRWRTYKYWAPYTQEQIDSAAKLVIKLCDELGIPKNVIGHNTKVELIDEYEGVLYKSNLDKNYTDLSPAWDFEGFKNKIETI